MESLPEEMLLEIFSRLPAKDLERVAHVSQEFRQVVQTQSLWAPSARTSMSLLKSLDEETFCRTKALWIECDCRRRERFLNNDDECHCLHEDEEDLPDMPKLRSLRISLRRGGGKLLKSYGSKLHTLYLDDRVQDLCPLSSDVATYCTKNLKKLFFPVPECKRDHLREIAGSCWRIETLALITPFSRYVPRTNPSSHSLELLASWMCEKAPAYFPCLRTLIDFGNKIYPLYNFVKCVQLEALYKKHYLAGDQTMLALLKTKRLHTLVLGSLHIEQPEAVPLRKWKETLRVLGFPNSLADSVQCYDSLTSVHVFVGPRESPRSLAVVKNLHLETDFNSTIDELCLNTEFCSLV